jgi:hypothetical protein
MLPEKAKDCRREEGGHAGDPLSFSLFLKSLNSFILFKTMKLHIRIDACVY